MDTEFSIATVLLGTAALVFGMGCSIVADPSDLVATETDGGGFDAKDISETDMAPDRREDSFDPEQWHLDGARYRIPLILDNSRQEETDLVGFPILVTLSSGNFDYTRAAADGSDLRFVDPTDASELPYELDTWVLGGKSHIWVRVPLIERGSTTRTVEMYFGDPDAADRQNPAAVFADNFVGVFHMNEPARDSSPEATVVLDDVTNAEPGVVGIARRRSEFGASGLLFEADSYPLGLSPRTLCASARLDEPTESFSSPLLTYGQSSGAWAHGMFEAEGALLCGYNERVVQADDAFEGDYRYLCCTYDGTTQRAYVNGVLAASPLDRSITLSEGPGTIGGRRGGTYFHGAIDEARVSNVVRSDDWMAAEYHNLVGAFVNVGAAQTRPAE